MMQIADKTISPEGGEHACRACGIGFYNEADLEKHVQRRHGKLTPLGKSSFAASVVALGLRVYLGSVMVMHGIPKLTTKKEHAIRAMEGLGVPSALTLMTALLEFVGGISLILGFLVPVVSTLFVGEMIGTTLLSKFRMNKVFLSGGQKPAYELDVI
jgi:uncharacterized membrane protein YphA (DoxX/SURF4 family)